MGVLDYFKQYGLFPRTDVQATQSQKNQSRSESVISINPTNTSNLIAASKKFIDPDKYHFTVAVIYTHDDGKTWTEANLPIPNNWDGMTDPVLGFDHLGRAFLVVEPLRFDPNDITIIGMQVFQSTDGGQTWTEPMSLIADRSVDDYDDKSWIACDRSNNLFTRGRIYVAWGVGKSLRLARSLDGGQTWNGVGNLPTGASVPGTNNAWAPEITIGDDGTIHVVWHVPGSSTINYTRSLDGGETFEPQSVVVTGVTSFTGTLPQTGNYPEFPNAKFRVLTLVTGCSMQGGRFLVAWADMREGLARIYYRIAENSGETWIGPANGQPLLPWFPANNGLNHFHPQIVTTESGVVGCAFYEFGLKGDTYKIDTRLVASFSQGKSFDLITTVTDKPWDPSINAPLSHGNPNDTFIGEYFGLDADTDTFAVIWTDTRTGIQELFYDRIRTNKTIKPDGIFGEILVGITNDGAGYIIIGGKITKIPPWGPHFSLLQSMVALDTAIQIDQPKGKQVVHDVAKIIEGIAKNMRI
ncbi:sialidase family protein [Bacillus toyonensis]|uniref:sialidase family protein n=1 Tax=Bacillus toyonensis TaxID=155322 RepID=UPI000CD97BD7|nr:sialidase family protein [Bacillus toyonensis]MED3542273.1 sialidase family protein [Bacillus toyonensis]MEE2020806.1 sialidase family protein [Bacillus toyonensis]